MELGKYDHFGELRPFTLPDERRLQHTLFIGKPRTGKTTALDRIALDDIYSGEPIVTLTSTILPHIPEESDLLYFHPQWDKPFPFNLLANIRQERHAQFADTFLGTIKGVNKYDFATPTMDMYFRICVMTLLEENRSTLVSLKKLLTDIERRGTIVGRVEDPILREFWMEFDELTPKDKRQEIASTLNKVYAFILDKTLRDTIGHRQNAVVFKDKVFIANLKDMGSESAKILGAFLLTQLYIEGLDGLRTHLFVDDAAPYAAILERIMADCPEIDVTYSLRKHSPLADCAGTIVAFRTSVADAAEIEPEFGFGGMEGHLYELPPFEAEVALDGTHKRLIMQPHDYPLTLRDPDTIME